MKWQTLCYFRRSFHEARLYELGQRRKAQASWFGKLRARYIALLSPPWAGSFVQDTIYKITQEYLGTRSWIDTMGQNWHSLDLQKLILTKLTEVMKNSARIFGYHGQRILSSSVPFFLIMFQNLSFSLTAQSMKPNKTECTTKSLLLPSLSSEFSAKGCLC